MNDCKLDDCTDRHGSSMLVNERGVKVAGEQESTPRRSSRGDVGIRASKPASEQANTGPRAVQMCPTPGETGLLKEISSRQKPNGDRATERVKMEQEKQSRSCM